MKKRLMIVLLMFFAITVFASGNKESRLSIGGEISRATENSTVYGIDYKTTLTSVGGFLQSYDFAPNENAGIFIHDSFLIPTGGKIESLGSSIDYSYSNADFRSHLGLIIGAAYKTSINKTIDFRFGIGPSIHQLNVSEYPNSAIGYMFGIGVDAGFHLFTSEKKFIDFGVVVDYSFANYTDLNGTGGWATDYSLTSIRPYLGAGFVL